MAASQAQIEVYVGDTGYIVIRQDGGWDDDSVITLCPIHAEAVANAILRAKNGAEEARKEWVEDENVEPS